MTDPINIDEKPNGWPHTKAGRAELVESVKSRLGPTIPIDALTTFELLRIEERHRALGLIRDAAGKHFWKKP